MIHIFDPPIQLNRERLPNFQRRSRCAHGTQGIVSKKRSAPDQT